MLFGSTKAPTTQMFTALCGSTAPPVGDLESMSTPLWARMDQSIVLKLVVVVLLAGPAIDLFVLMS